MNASIDQIIDLIRMVVQSAAPDVILPIILPFLPDKVKAVVAWAVEHKDCLDELLAALKGAFGDDSSGGKLDEILPVVQEIRQEAA